ncbi:probable galacturonosyltransferase 7 isoform X1 [Beta vulgaris subsp. vulgaris]|uniref:probable galacturonosyltransferase 7 isoform X1 n=1 Tax=Beta vulgaris subsp. vulgaris TaxID=3555 RepID=UPI002037620F|nr:probable galacturonosyltransferase 7 isoform X1 [Beta vulgaris subsp. vulgaris]
MKGGAGGGGVGGGGVGANAAVSTKRRWRGFVIAVLGLVILSMLVPLVFLLGFHNAFHNYSSSSGSGSGFPSQQQASSDSQEHHVHVALGGYQSHNPNTTMDPDQDQEQDQDQDQHDQTIHIKDLIHRLAPTLPKEHIEKPDQEISVHSGINKSTTKAPMQDLQPKGSHGNPLEKDVHKASPEGTSVNISSPDAVIQIAKGDERLTLCELRFGSYCLWRREYKEAMMDVMVKKLKDRLFVARAYFPSIAKLPVHEKLSRELKQNIQDFERMLSESTTDADLPPHVEDKLWKMEAAIAKAKSVPVDCSNVDKKFRQLVDLTEDEANFHTKQSSFLYQLAVQTMPKSLHCLSMRLTVEYFHTNPLDVEDSVTEKYVDPELYHYVILSNNILAASVAINSTVIHAKESRKLVFHVLTDRQNYFAMTLWFGRNTFKKATIQVLNIEEYNRVPGLLLPQEFRVTFQSAHKLPRLDYKTEYVSLFSRSHYLLPQIFKNLDKIVVLDDDIVVQQDLSPLWRINMGRMVIGAAEFCSVRLGQLDKYLGGVNFNRNSCSWMSGMNVIDLARWRELNLTGTFRKTAQELKRKGRLPEAAASMASLLAFQDLVYALDDMWVLSGLGHDYGLNLQSINKFAVLHYNGNMKPWLELGIPKYRSLWFKYLNRQDQLLSDCNVIP